MGRPKKLEEEKKDSITITPSKEILAFIDSRVDRHVFASRTHGFERAVRFYMDNERSALRQEHE